jgi:cell division protein FtsB
MNAAASSTQQTRNRLKRSAIRVGIVLLLAGALLTAALHWQTYETQQQTIIQAQLAQTQEQLRQTQRARDNVERHLHRYRTLEMSGFTAAPDRVALIEALLAAQARLALPTIRYTLSPVVETQFPLPPEASPWRDSGDTSPAQIAYQPLELKLVEVHEGEWLAFLADVQQNAPGWSRIERCALRRSGALGLDVDCTLRWWFTPPIHGEAEE